MGWGWRVPVLLLGGAGVIYRPVSCSCLLHDYVGGGVLKSFKAKEKKNPGEDPLVRAADDDQTRPFTTPARLTPLDLPYLHHAGNLFTLFTS